MNLIRKFRIGVIFLVLAFSMSGSASTAPTGKFDEFGDVNCEDEMSHLDNFAVQLQQEPSARGVIIFYGGRRFRGRLPKRGEAAARAARIKPYLVQRRGIPTDQVIVIDGGYAEEWKVDLWVVPKGATIPAPFPTVPVKDIRFRKGKPNPRDYECRI